METGSRCDKVYNMYVGGIHEHKEGMCPSCIKAQAGAYGRPMGTPAQISQFGYPAQARQRVTQERAERQAQSMFNDRHGGPSSGPTSGHPSSEPPLRGYDSFTRVNIPQYPVHQPPQILPQNLSAHTPIPIPPIPPAAAAAKPSHYKPPGRFPGSGPSMLSLRPVFEVPTKGAHVETANWKQGMGTRPRNSSSTSSTQRPKRSATPDDDEEYEPYEPYPKPLEIRPRKRAHTNAQSSPGPQPIAQPQPRPRPCMDNGFFSFGLDDYDPYGFQPTFFNDLGDLDFNYNILGGQPAQPETYIDPQLFQQPSQTQDTRSQYPTTENNGGYIPPIFGQKYPFEAPGVDNHGLGVPDEDLIWDMVDWEKVEKGFQGTTFDDATGLGVEPDRPVVDGTKPMDTPTSTNSHVQTSNLEVSAKMPSHDQQHYAYSFPGSILPMPAMNMHGQKTQMHVDNAPDVEEPGHFDDNDLFNDLIFPED